MEQHLRLYSGLHVNGPVCPLPLDMNLHMQKHAYLGKNNQSSLFFAILFTLSYIGFYGFSVSVQFMQIFFI